MHLPGKARCSAWAPAAAGAFYPEAMDHQDVTNFYRWRKKGYHNRNTDIERKWKCFWWASRAFKYNLIFSFEELQQMKDSGWTKQQYKAEALKWAQGKSLASNIKFIQLMLWMSDWTYISPYRNRDPTMKDYLRTLQREYYGQ